MRGDRILGAARKIGVLLPIKDKGTQLDLALKVIKVLYRFSKKEGFEIVFSCVENYYNEYLELAELIEYGVEIRETKWIEVKRADIQVSLEYIQRNQQLKYDNYSLPTDGIKDFTDCDSWILISDKTKFPLAPIKPYCLVEPDYTYRYVPEYLSKKAHKNKLTYIQNARNANLILSQTPQTCMDAIQYAGIEKKKCNLLSTLFEVPRVYTEKYFKKEFEYIVWAIDSEISKNYKNIMEALKIYFNSLAGDLKIVVIYREHELPNYITKSIAECKTLKKNIKILDRLNKSDYFHIIQDAKFLLHPSVYGNGSLDVVAAAYYKVPTISNRYPQMEYLHDRFKINLTFCNAINPIELVKTIEKCNENYSHLQQSLPSRKQLEALSLENGDNNIWKIIKGSI